MKESLASYIAQQQLAHPGHRILVACSGGMDSVVLAHLLHTGGYTIGLAHMHFGLRGADADADQALVGELARLWQVPFYTRQVYTEAIAEAHHQSIQVAARELRYAWLQELADTHRYHRIATGHHANDNLETALHHLMRGTGISGIRGIPPRNEQLIRPLLWATRQQLEEYAQTHALTWREDTTNQEDKYLRNRIRHHVVPAMEALQPALVAGSVHTMANLRLAEQLYLERLQQYRRKLLRPVGREWHIPIRRLLSYPMPAHLLYALTADLGFTLEAIGDLLDSQQSGKLVHGANHRLIRHGNTLILASAEEEERSWHQVETGAHTVRLPNGTLTISTEIWNPHKTIPTTAHIAAIDLQQVTWPLTIRPWQKGDYLYPLGMTKRHSDKPGKKKVSDLFQSLKLSLTDKENAWMVLSGDRILWAMPYRIDERFKVTPQTKEILLLRWHPA